MAALVAALFHTQSAYLYFRPSVQDLLGFFRPPGSLWVSEWLRHAGRLAAAAVFFISLPGLGNFLRRSCFPQVSSNAFLHAGLAVVFWSTLGFLLAGAGLSSPPALKTVSVVLACAGLWLGRDPSARAEAGRLFGWARYPGTSGWVKAAAWAFAILLLATTVVPDIFYDALVYHLAVPAAWMREGRFTDLPHVHHSRLPGLAQGLYLWGLAWADDRLCKILNWGVGVMTAWALADWTAKRRTAAAGAWAALFFLSSPMIGVNVWSCTNDILCAFLFLTAFAIWVEGWDRAAGVRSRYLAAAGLLFGAAAAAKYTALFGAPFFVVDFILRLRAERDAPGRAPVRWAGAFALGVLAPLLPWWIRTGVLTGNPFFPEAAAWLGGDIPENVALLSSWKDEARGAGGFLSRLLSLLRESLRGVEEGRFGFVGPVLLMLLPLALFSPLGRPLRAVALCVGVSYLFFATQTGRLRYFIPQMGLLFAAAAVFLADYSAHVAAARRSADAGTNLARRLRPDPARWLKSTLAVMLALNAVWLILVFDRFNEGWDVVWGRQSPSEYLRQEHIGVYGHPSQGAFDYLADRPKAGKILLIGEARTYRSPVPALAGGSFNVPPYVRLLEAAPLPGLFLDRLRAEGYTHVLLNTPEWRRLTPDAYKSQEYLRALGAVLDALAPPVYQDRWAMVFNVPE